MAALIVVTAVTAVLVYVAARAVGQVTLLQQQNGAAVTAVDTSSWTAYHNAQAGFSLEYPPNWQIFAGGLAANTPFVAIGNPLNGTTTYVVDVFIEQNPQSLSSAEFVHQSLIADRAEDAANAKTDSAPTVTPQFKSDSLLTVNGIPAYELYDVFEFDHDAEQIYVATGTFALRFDFPVAAANPNLASPANNNAIARMIVDTLTFP